MHTFIDALDMVWASRFRHTCIDAPGNGLGIHVLKYLRIVKAYIMH